MLLVYLSSIEDSREKSRFRLFYEKYIGLINYGAGQLTSNPAEREDIVHETFLRIISQFGSIRTDNEKETVSLVYTITKYCGIDYLRKNRKELYLEDLTQEEIPEQIANEEFMVDKVYINNIVEAIDRMDPMYSIPLQLKTDGYTIDEIAVFLGITQQSAKVRIHRARKILKQELGCENG